MASGGSGGGSVSAEAGPLALMGDMAGREQGRGRSREHWLEARSVALLRDGAVVAVEVEVAGWLQIVDKIADRHAPQRRAAGPCPLEVTVACGRSGRDSHSGSRDGESIREQGR